jgi:charged multivesicular body protein 2A
VYKLCSGWQGGDEEEETDKLVMQVYEEIGINAADGMVSAPQAKVPIKQAEGADTAPQPVAADEAGPSGVDADLEARLNALRGK